MSPTNTARSRTVDIQHLTHAGSLAMRLIGPASDSATVLLRGGQLVSWVNAQGREMLHAWALPWGSALRLRCGGLSLRLPHQAQDGPLAYLSGTQHADWRVHDAWFHRGVPHLSLCLHSPSAGNASRPHEVACYLDMVLHSPQLLVALKVVNLGQQALQFSAAMQPCFRQVSASAGRWTAAPGAVSLPCADGQLELSAGGFADVALWSPWLQQDRGALRAGVAQGAGLVCFDAATRCQSTALAPGSQWLGTQRMRWNAQPPL